MEFKTKYGEISRKIDSLKEDFNSAQNESERQKETAKRLNGLKEKMRISKQNFKRRMKSF
jgi:FtsZ-binding cell division protein ZapB